MHFSFSAFVVLAAYVATGVLGQTNGTTSTPDQSKDVFKKADIPQDLHINFDPKSVLHVAFPQQGSGSGDSPSQDGDVKKDGEQLPKDDAANPPTFRLCQPVPADMGKGPFVVAIMDPDSPTPENPTDGPVRQFLGGDFHLKDDGFTLANNTPAITEYQVPNPQQGSNPHRFVFLLFKQPDGFKDQTEVTPDTGRPSFNVSGFAEKLGMGDPVAGAYVKVAPEN